MSSPKSRPWEHDASDETVAANGELASKSREAWRCAGREELDRRGVAGVSLRFLKEVQGHSPTTFNNSTNLIFKAGETTLQTGFVARTPATRVRKSTTLNGA